MFIAAIGRYSKRPHGAASALIVLHLEFSGTSLIFLTAPPAAMKTIFTPSLFFPEGTPNIAPDTSRLVLVTLAGLIAIR